MKSRLALTTILAVGVLMSGSGAGLAVSGISDSGNASSAQYAPATPPATTGTSAAVPSTTAAPSTTTAPSTTAAPSAVQPARQAATAQKAGLPFTGLLAIPLVVIGLALTATGVVLRRRTARG